MWWLKALPSTLLPSTLNRALMLVVAAGAAGEEAEEEAAFEEVEKEQTAR